MSTDPRSARLDRFLPRAGREVVAQAPRRVLVAAGVVAVTAWFIHVWIIATAYDGTGATLPTGELIPGPDNRVIGSLGVLAWTTLIGVVVGLVALAGWRRAVTTIMRRAAYVGEAWAASRRGLGMGLAAGTVGALTGLLVLRPALGGAFIADPFGGRDVAAAVALVAAGWLAFAATAPLGGAVARAVGTVLVRADAGAAPTVGSVTLSGAAGGLLVFGLIGSPVIVLMVVAVAAAAAWWRLRIPSATAVLLVAFTVGVGVAMATPAAGDDGGWTECGSSLSGYIGCDGSGAVYGDALWSVPAAFVGGGMGTIMAAAVLAGTDRPRIQPDDGPLQSAGVECRARPDPSPQSVVTAERSPRYATIGLRPRRDLGDPRMRKVL